MLITENFDSEEFKCHCGCGLSNIKPELVHRLQVIRDIAGTPIIITSGCRCGSWNAHEGGAYNSFHIYGMACDWTISDVAILDMIATMLKDWSGGFHYYPNNLDIHTDIGPRRRW